MSGEVDKIRHSSLESKDDAEVLKALVDGLLDNCSRDARERDVKFAIERKNGVPTVYTLIQTKGDISELVPKAEDMIVRANQMSIAKRKRIVFRQQYVAADPKKSADKPSLILSAEIVKTS